VSLAAQTSETQSLASLSLSRRPLNPGKGSYDNGHDHRPVGVTSTDDPYAVQNRGSTSARRSNHTSWSQSSAPSDLRPQPTLSDRDPFSGRSRPGVADTTRTGGRHPKQKGAPVQLPFTAGQSLSHTSPADLLVDRMNAEGRPQDLGHIPVEDEMPPPNYHQTTESQASPRS